MSRPRRAALELRHPGRTLRKTKTFKAVLPTGAEKSRITSRRLRRPS